MGRVVSRWLEKGRIVRIALSLLIWMVVCSAVSMTQYGLDKRWAKLGKRRIPEKTLLLTCLLGGWPGALLGGKVFRHKTVKKPYRQMFFLAVVGNMALFIGVTWVLWPLSEG